MTVTLTERQARRALYHTLVTAPLLAALGTIGWWVMANGLGTVASQYAAQFGVGDVVAIVIGFVYPTVARRLSRRTAAYLVRATDEGGLLNVRPDPLTEFAKQVVRTPLR